MSLNCLVVVLDVTEEVCYVMLCACVFVCLRETAIEYENIPLIGE